jgi:hypothetical protein
VLSDAYWTRSVRPQAPRSSAGRSASRALPFTIIGVASPGYRGEDRLEIEAPDDLDAVRPHKPEAPAYILVRPTARRGCASSHVAVPGIDVVMFFQARAGRGVRCTAHSRRRRRGTCAMNTGPSCSDSRLRVRQASSGPRALRRFNCRSPAHRPAGDCRPGACEPHVPTWRTVTTPPLSRERERGRRQRPVCRACGAGRWRLVRQAMSRPCWLSITGGVAGFGAGRLGHTTARGADGWRPPIAIDASPDGRVFGLAGLCRWPRRSCAGSCQHFVPPGSSRCPR